MRAKRDADKEITGLWRDTGLWDQPSPACNRRGPGGGREGRGGSEKSGKGGWCQARTLQQTGSALLGGAGRGYWDPG